MFGKRGKFMQKKELEPADYQLIERALEVLKNTFDDGIYNHTVGCSVLGASGQIYSGVNCDGLHGSCAEYITMGIAISSYEKEFKTIVAVNEHAPNGVISPCGNCRQMLLEYAPGIDVIVNDETGKLVKVKIEDLLPFAWHRLIIEE